MSDDDRDIDIESDVSDTGVMKFMKNKLIF